MPRSSASEEYAGVSKEKRVMRRGTRSCFLCRRRKIRCSGAGPHESSCAECKSRGDTCVAQGIIADDDATINKRLKERIAYLESRLRTAGVSSDDKEQNGPSGALQGLLSGIENDTRPPDGLPAGSSTDERAEEEVETCQAPLMRLLSNPVFGASQECAITLHGSRPHQETTGPSLLRPRSNIAKDKDTLRDLSSHLPSEATMSDILDKYSSWWPLYRETLGFQWGGDLPDLRSFAVQTLSAPDPPAVALLLVCFAIGTGDLDRYLPPVERRILNDDQYAATEYGLNCLMALGLCYMSSLQPRRAWTVYRHANTLLQLNGIHLQHRSDRHELLFWQLFHADRWVSLMIGLPYMTPNHMCQLTIAPIGVLGAGTWMYRQLGVLTGRVVDCIQNARGPTLSTALEVEEDLENMRSQLPPGYLDLAMIRAASDATDKYTRLYRVVHYHLLKGFIHLPFFLRSANESRFEFSRKSCIDDSRQLLEAYLEIFDSDPRMAHYGTVISFTAFTSAVIVILGLFRYGLPQRPEYISSPAQLDHDWRVILRVQEALKHGATSKVAGRLCSRCHIALQSMIDCATKPASERLNRIVLPYFGTLNFSQQTQTAEPGVVGSSAAPHSENTAPQVQQPTSDWTRNVGLGGVSMTYDGPFLPDSDLTSWMLGLESGYVPDANMREWNGTHPVEADWDWMFADLPPNSGL